MKVANQSQCIEMLKNFHQEMDSTSISSKITDKIAEFIDENGEFLKGNIEIVSELDAIAVMVKTNSYDNPLINKIRLCVRQILPEECQSTLDVLRKSQNGVKSIAEWIELMNIPIDDLPLTTEELFEMLRNRVKDIHTPSHPGYASIGQITRHLVKLNGQLDDHEQRIVIALAKHFVQQDCLGTVLHIQDFCIKDQSALVEIAKLGVQSNAGRTAEFIHNFGIKSQAALVEIAKLCAQADSRATPEFIQNFGIKDQASLVEIAKLCAQADGGATAQFIQNFGIQEQAALAEIAMSCALQNAWGTATYIQNFGIKSQAALVEIAKCCAQKDGAVTAEHIQKFGIKDQAALVEIAILCAQQNGRRTAIQIKNFGIQDQAALVVIAKHCALQNSGATAEYIQRFGIKDQVGLVEIAKLCAQMNGSATAEHIQNFGIEDQAALAEIAMLCAQQNGWKTANHIKKFGIQDQVALVKIAMSCALQNAWGTVIYIQNFGIKDQAALVEIAKLCAQMNGAVTAEHIQRFGIQDQAALAEIAKICAQQDGASTAEYMNHFKIKDKLERLKIFMECLAQDKLALFYIRKFTPLPESFQNVFNFVTVLRDNAEEPSKRYQLFNAFNDLIKGLKCSETHRAEIYALCKNISELDPHLQSSQGLWFLQNLWLMTQVGQSAVDWVVESGLLRDLSAFRDPKLKQQLSSGLFELASSDEGRNRWSQFLSSAPSVKGMRLLAIPLYGLESQGIAREWMDEMVKKVLKPQILKDAFKIQSLLQLTHLLTSSPLLTQEQKVSAFNKIFLAAENPKQIMDNLTAAKGLLQMKERSWTDSKGSIRQIFQSAFEKCIPLHGFQGDACLRFEKTFGSSRNPEGLFIYAAGLQTQNEPELLNCLSRYVVSVFNGTFPQSRYDTKDNPHLTTIYAARPDLKKKWENCREMKLQHVFRGVGSQTETFDVKNWLIPKLQEGHLGNEDVSYVLEYLDASDDDTRKEVKMRLSEELSNLSKGKKKSELDQDQRVLNLKIQLTCINLAGAGERKSLAALESHFKAIDQSLKSKGIQEEFLHDVDGILKHLSQFQNTSTDQELNVMISDDPIDLLLAGTDVAGSCQRLNGSPSLNKGLLGYLVDGKNQLLVIKDRNGKIVARALLRLLWDGKNPVLYREPFYPATISEKERDALNQMAIQLAKECGLSLTADEEQGQFYDKDLHALGGPAPCEYCDALKGISTGIYTIHKARLLFLNNATH